jgi:glycine/D-amino acid oxidase-like deaminating enzyme
MRSMRVLVVGGGIGGLSAAFGAAVRAGESEGLRAGRRAWREVPQVLFLFGCAPTVCDHRGLSRHRPGLAWHH